MKNIGKPYTGKPYVRFDEGGLAKESMDWLLRHRQTKGAETDRPIPTESGGCPLLYRFQIFMTVSRSPSNNPHYGLFIIDIFGLTREDNLPPLNNI